jgi:flagellar biosynthesis protein FliR
MSTRDLTTLLAGISVTHVIAFFIVLARVTPLFVVAPIFSSQLLIPRARSVLGVALALGLTPIAMHGQKIPTSLFPVVGLLVSSFFTGLVVAYAVACVFGAIQGAGAIADLESGFSYGASVDPINGNQGGALTNFYTIVGTALFLVIGGDAWVLRGLAATFRVVPIGSGLDINASLISGIEQMLITVTLGAVEIAAPLILAVTISDVAFGMVSKVAPQLNVFAVNFPVKVGVSLLIVAVSIPFIGNWLSDELQVSVTSAVQLL